MWERHEIKNINSTEQDLIYEIKIGDVVFDVVYHLRVYNNFNNQWVDYDGVCGNPEIAKYRAKEMYYKFHS